MSGTAFSLSQFVTVHTQIETALPQALKEYDPGKLIGAMRNKSRNLENLLSMAIGQLMPPKIHPLGQFNFDRNTSIDAKLAPLSKRNVTKDALVSDEDFPDPRTGYANLTASAVCWDECPVYLDTVYKWCIENDMVLGLPKDMIDIVIARTMPDSTMPLLAAGQFHVNNSGHYNALVLEHGLRPIHDRHLRSCNFPPGSPIDKRTWILVLEKQRSPR